MRLLHDQFSSLFQFRAAFLIGFVLVLSCSALRADTTWVAGEVYGTWTRDGNPYLVTDTLIVPLDSTLNIEPGVQIWFLDQQIRRTPIYVYGRLRAIGAEGDSIYFYSPFAGFGGISNRDTPGTEIRMQYCVVDSLHERIRSRQGLLVLKHCHIYRSQAEFATLISCSESIDTVQYCSLIGGDVHFSSGGPSVFQHNHGDDFIPTWQQMAPIVGNQLQVLFLDESPWMEVYDNELQFLSVWRGSAFIHDNDIQGSCMVDQSNVIFEDNMVEHISIVESQGTYRNNVVHDSLNNYGIELFSSNSVTVEKNLITTGGWGIRIYDSNNNLIRNNTVIFGDKGVYAYSGSASNQIINNIFVGDGVNCTGIYSSGQDPFTIQYNDFHNMTSVTYGCELDSGNIFLDPYFRAGNPYDYQLQANSPCIDAGDPASPLDPDGSRADMGAYFFDHRIDNPPAIISPVVINVQHGTMLRYVAHATDDHGPLRFGFWDVPGWLHRVDELMDFEEKTAVVSGRVPQGQADFMFGVWAEDGRAQRDSQEVSVLVSQYTILAGEVTGVLTREQSPYMVVEDVVVPAGDSLVIEPGVEIRFQWEPVEDLRHRILVRGTLHAVGTPEDTIYLLPEYGDSLARGWRGIWFLGSTDDTSNFEYSCFLWGVYGIVADSQAAVVLEHSDMLDIGNGIYVRSNSTAKVDSSRFLVYDPYFNTFVRSDSATAFVTNCQSEFMVTYSPAMHFNFEHGSTGLVQGCNLVGGGSARAQYGSNVSFIGNRAYGIGYGIQINFESSGVIANNIVSNSQRGICVAIYDSLNTTVTNNVLYHNSEYGIEIYAMSGSRFPENNLLISNGTGIYALYNTNPIDISYNAFWGNDCTSINCILDSTNFYVDPMLQDTIDFQLSFGSPCIDAGDPDPFFNDVDSTRNDIGCWGGPWGESYPYVPVLSYPPKPIPAEFTLLPPYPNPFNSVLVIPFSIPIEREVTITVYNILGQKVQDWTLPHVSPGVHRIIWNAESCASGIYIVRLMSDGKGFNQKVVLLK